MLRFEKNPENNLTIIVPECKGIRYVISDIHGCSETFKTLVDKIKLTKNDQLFLLGDYIDRGRNSKAVIDYILELSNAGFQVFPLKGNHEDMLEKKSDLFIVESEVEYEDENFRELLYNANHEIEKKYIDFIEQLPYFIELENCILVHAGFEFDIDEPFTFADAMLWIRGWDYDAIKAKNKFVIYGHTPASIHKIRECIKSKSPQIPLDNGCVFSEEKNYGNLLCLNINDFTLTIQENIEYV